MRLHLSPLALVCLFVGSIQLLAPARATAEQLALADLDLTKATQQWGSPGKNISVEGHPLSIGGQSFKSGVGGHAQFELWIDTHGSAENFTCNVGVDDEVKSSDGYEHYGVIFSVYGDGKMLYRSHPLHGGQPSEKLDLDLHGVQKLFLEAEPAQRSISLCHADFADGVITYSGSTPASTIAEEEPAEILTPQPPVEPHIHSALAFGVRPNHPVLYTVAATGDRPMTFSADGLPETIHFDSESGQMSGSIGQSGSYTVHLQATNARGVDKQTLNLVVGDKIALTPPMGWNSWNCFESTVSQEKVQAAADCIIKTGLANHGWAYVNMDDGWEIPFREPESHRRTAQGRIIPNSKFPDVKAMVDYIHSKGLRAGLYSSPGPATCGGYTASYKHELDDAQQYADWGFDYLKYDCCSYYDIINQIKRQPNPPTNEELIEHPYQVMHEALAKQNRDIVYSFSLFPCQVYKWGPAAGGNCWRLTDDIHDNWPELSAIAFGLNDFSSYAGPGHWNDPDMLVVGRLTMWGKSRQTQLTPNEQYTHISMWSLLSAPLLIGCDLTQIDPFTLSLLTNDEVLAIDQDALGKAASRVWNSADQVEGWVKPLSDGSHAVGVFNRGPMQTTVHVKWSDLQLDGHLSARDLWRQKDIAVDADGVTLTIRRHGCALLRVARSQ